MQEQLRDGMTKPEALGVQGMLKSKGITSGISASPNPNFRLKNPFRYGITVDGKDLPKCQRILRNYDDKILRKHTSMIVLRNGDIGEVPAKLIERCPTCNGAATVVPNRNKIRQLLLVPPAIILGILAAWVLHRPQAGDSSSYMVTGAISFICAAAAFVPLLLIFGRGRDTLNFRHCPKCNKDWDLEENLVDTDKG